MTIQFLAKKIVPDFPVRIRAKEGVVEEKLAGDIQNSKDEFYQTHLKDWTFYRKYLVIDI